MSDFRDRIGKLSPKRLALLALELHERLEAAEAEPFQPIAIVGIGCRLPGAANPEAFWELLCEGRDAITEVPPERWNVDDYYDPDPEAPGKMSTRFGGFLPEVDRFDPECFGISPREALTMDPQQRLLLEVGWEALEHAGVSPEKLHGSHTGVFVGMSSTDFSANMMRSGQQDILDVHFATGNARSVAAGRISYVLGLHGPSICIDTACSSSLVATHLACQSLRTHDCDLALAGGVNLILSPDVTIGLSRAHMMAPDGRCKAFDARADGFVRGEGCGLLVLQRLPDALAAGANVIAVIRGSASNQDGRSSGITAPNGPAQEDAMRRALQACGGVDAGDVAFVEAHGTGTALGDPIEVRALSAIYGAGHGPERKLAIGSVKTNIGHLESAAGVAGLIKAALTVQHGEIPATLHLTELNPHLEWDEMPFWVPTGRSPWPSGYGRRLAAVSSFGFSGTNAHVILEQAPTPMDGGARAAAGDERPVHLLPLSARTEAALQELCGRYVRFLERRDAAWADVCFTAATGRAHHPHRAAVVAESTDQAITLLRSLESGATPPGSRRGTAPTKGATEVVFLFTGQGAQYAGMGRRLFETEPVFRASLEECQEVLQPLVDRPLLSVIYPEPGGELLVDETAYTQPALFALEYALAQLWRSWGIEPAAALGHSIGEYVAACIAGVFDLPDALRLVAARARLMQALPAGGEMVALAASEERVAEALAPYAAEVSIAACNGPESVVISGASAAVGKLVGELESEGIRAKRLTVSHAFHSPLMEPMLEEFEGLAAEVSYAAPRFGIASNVTGRIATGDDLRHASYWRNHLRGTVRFAEGMRTLVDKGYTVFLEVGPKATLLGMASECIPGSTLAWLPTLRPGKDDCHQVLESLAALYVNGVEIDWAGFDSDRLRHRVVLPTYPFQRERYWPEAASPQPAGGAPVAVRDETEDWVYEIAWRAVPHPAGPAAAEMPELDAIGTALGGRVADLAGANNVARYAALGPGIDALCLAYVLDAFRELGWRPREGDVLTVDSLSRQLGIVEAHARLIGRLLHMLAEEGILQENDAEWTVRALPAPSSTGDLFADLRQRFPDNEAELVLLGRCGDALADVLRGGDPLQVLFPDGSLSTTEQLYRDAPVARVFNTLIADGIEMVLDAIPADRKVRFLEIGGGTGGTTSHLLPRLDPDRTEYRFTDVSRLFTARAEESFAAFPFARFGLLDIGQDPIAQGFEEGGFDVVIAANVLHATADLRKTVQNVRRLLAPGGLLALLEGISPQRFADLTVGLTDGWWGFTDTELRPSYALLERQGWQDLLAAEGFTDVQVLPGDPEAGESWAQQIVVFSRAPVDKEAHPSAAATPSTWLILADQGGVGESLAAELRGRGDVAVTVTTGESFEADGDGGFRVDATARDHYERLLREVTDGELDGVVYLWALDAPAVDDHTGEGVVGGQEIVCSGALHLIRALAHSQRAGFPELWIVTRGAQPVGEAPGRLTVEQTPLLGMAKVVALEHPELHCRRVDLDPTDEQPAATLLAELDAGAPDDQVAIRGGERRVARLAHVPGERIGPINAPGLFHANATYLITGAFGGLGIPLAQWMLDGGGRHFVLSGRREPGEDARRAIERLRERGAEIVVARADVSNREDVRRMLDDLEREMPPLRGVFHLAGSLDDGVLVQQSWDRFANVMASKIAGSWNLHTETSEAKLDFFVLFSTGASLIGSPGQGNHAAANAFLDALAHDRRARALPGTTINWGAWADVGAAVQHDLAAATAFRLMPPAAALRCLGRILAGECAQVGVLDVNWATAAKHAFGDIPFLREVMGATSVASIAAPEPRQGLRQALEDAVPARRRALLHDRVALEAAGVLGIDPSKRIDPERPLQELGLDSLMAVELRNALGEVVESELPATLLFDHPTLDQLVDFVARWILDPAEATRIDADAAAREDDDALSEDDLEELLATKLEGIEGNKRR